MDSGSNNLPSRNFIFSHKNIDESSQSFGNINFISDLRNYISVTCHKLNNEAHHRVKLDLQKLMDESENIVFELSVRLNQDSSRIKALTIDTVPFGIKSIDYENDELSALCEQFEKAPVGSQMFMITQLVTAYHSSALLRVPTVTVSEEIQLAYLKTLREQYFKKHATYVTQIVLIRFLLSTLTVTAPFYRLVKNTLKILYHCASIMLAMLDVAISYVLALCVMAKYNYIATDNDEAALKSFSQLQASIQHCHVVCHDARMFWVGVALKYEAEDIDAMESDSSESNDGFECDGKVVVSTYRERLRVTASHFEPNAYVAELKRDLETSKQVVGKVFEQIVDRFTLDRADGLREKKL